MPNKFNSYDFLIVITFLIVATVRYPLMYFYFYPSGTTTTSFYLSSLEVLSAYALFMIFFKYRLLPTVFKNHLFFTISIGVLFVIAVSQFLNWDNYTFWEFYFSIAWVAIPFAVFLYADTIKRIIIPYFAFLWCFNFVHLCWQLFNGIQSVGITGNRNWHGAFLIVSTPFFIYWLYRILKKKNLSEKLIVFILSFPAIFSLIALYKAESRAANLALIIGIILLIGLSLYHSSHIKYRKWAFIYLTSVAFIVIAGTVCGVLFFGDKLAEINSYDVRIPFWTGAWDMALENPWLGVGSPSYEGEYAYYMPIERFFRSHYFAGRATHPHNQFLYFAGSFGLLGLVAISYLWFFPIIHFFRNFKKLDILSKLVFFTSIMLTIHAMLDLVMMKWPTMQMAFILQGFLWSGTFSFCPEKSNIEKENTENLNILMLPLKWRFLYKLTCWCLLLCVIYMIFINIKTSSYSRSSNILAHAEQYSQSINNCNKAILIGNNRPVNIYNAGMRSLFWFGDYRLAYKYFKNLEKHPSKIIVHSNSRIAECLIKMGRKKEALAYLEKEIQVFPLSVIGLYNKLQLERKLGKTKDVEISANKLIKLLAFKGLKIQDLQKTLDHPEFDGRFHMLKDDK